MTFVVRELAKAKQDKRSIFNWLHQRSPTGAAAWLDAYDAAIDALRTCFEIQFCRFASRLDMSPIMAM